ncbi:type VI secretion system protein TssA [uncultured Cedecea sp.]|uniref:type VI secretion system protein TssA n=1 Tax=uncultured Cedecea sp. TaxID=988762 RepID=UPI0026018B84|nr:type VI secretion system protein TssA [uncultured Cedecea sp.]
MDSLQKLVAACGADEKQLRQLTHARTENWCQWLVPISDMSPAGEDPGYDDLFQRIREEVDKLSGVDTGLICELAEKLLVGNCKDLRVITFYIWARLHQEGESGFAQGIELLAAMLEQFGSQLHPRRDRSRKIALEWLGSNRIVDSLLLYPEVDISVMQRITGGLLLIEQAFNMFDNDDRPELGKLYQTLENRLIQSGGAKSLVPQNSREENGPSVSASSSPRENTVTSGRDLLDQAKILAKYLRSQPQGWLAGHHLLKSVRWDTLTELPPLDASGRTRLLPPKPDNKANLKRLYLQNNWSELLEHTDTLLVQGVNHLWLDMQWYAWQALLKLDTNSVRADILCRDLQGLLTRLPGLETMTFNDGMPFADDTTTRWINENILDDISGWKNEPVIPTLTSDDVLRLEPEALAKADSEGIEAALSWLQVQPGYHSFRDQWLIRLLMARVSEQYGKNEMALHLLWELNNSAQSLTFEQGVPELMFEVKARRLKLLRGKAGRSEADKIRLQSEMDVLLSGLISLDPARAAVLCN